MAESGWQQTEVFPCKWGILSSKDCTFFDPENDLSRGVTGTGVNRKWLHFSLHYVKAGCFSNSNNTTRIIQLMLLVSLLHTSTRRSSGVSRKQLCSWETQLRSEGGAEELKEEGYKIGATAKACIGTMDAKKGHA